MTAVRRETEKHDGPPDNELLRRVGEGNREAIGQLYDRYAQEVYGFVRRLDNGSEAEDVVQLTFMRIGEIAGKYDHRSLSARAWIFGVAHRIVQERRRSLRRFAQAMKNYADVRQRQPALSSGSEARDLERALACLSEPKRTALLLTQLHGFSCEEAASMLDLPIGTVWTRLHHARRELRAALEGKS